MHKKERTSFHALSRGPTKGPIRIHEEKMRPDGRISAYMPFVLEMFGRISAEQRVALMLHCYAVGGGLGMRRFSPPLEAEGIPLLRCQFQTYVIRACARTPLL